MGNFFIATDSVSVAKQKADALRSLIIYAIMGGHIFVSTGNSATALE